MDVQVVKQPGTNAWVFGGKNSTRVGARNVFLLNGKTWSVDYNSDDTRKSFSVGVLTRLNIDFDKNKVTINGASHYTYNWVYGVASTGTFVKNPEATWDVVGVNGVPEGWTVITE